MQPSIVLLHCIHHHSAVASLCKSHLGAAMYSTLSLVLPSFLSRLSQWFSKVGKPCALIPPGRIEIPRNELDWRKRAEGGRRMKHIHAGKQNQDAILADLKASPSQSGDTRQRSQQIITKTQHAIISTCVPMRRVDQLCCRASMGRPFVIHEPPAKTRPYRVHSWILGHGRRPLRHVGDRSL